MACDPKYIATLAKARAVQLDLSVFVVMSSLAWGYAKGGEAAASLRQMPTCVWSGVWYQARGCGVEVVTCGEATGIGHGRLSQRRQP